MVASAQASPTAGFSATRTGVARDGTEVFTFSGSSSNPLGNVGPIPVPAIDYGGTVIVSPNGSVTVNLSHDGFPGHELYVNGQLVYTYNPQQAGSGPLRLLPVTPSVNTQITLPAPGTPPHP